MAEPLRSIDAPPVLTRSAEDIEQTSAEYDQMEVWRVKPRDLMTGLDRLIEQSGDGTAATAYLPKNVGEDEEQYKFRRDHLTTLDPDFSDAVESFVGVVFPAPISLNTDELTDAEAEDAELFWEGVDRAGQQDADAFFANAAESTFAEALSWGFVDSVPFGPQGRESWPFFAHWPGAAVYYTRRTRDVLAEIRVRETSTDPEGNTTERRRIYYRGNPDIQKADVSREALERLVDEDLILAGEGMHRYVTFEVWKRNDAAKQGQEYELERSGIMLPPNNLPPEREEEFVEIPAFPLYSGYKSVDCAKPRLLPVADMVLLKFRLQSDQQAYLHDCAIAIPVIEGADKKAVEKAHDGPPKSGRGTILYVPQGAKFYWSEMSGASAAALQTNVDRLQERIDKAALAVMTTRATGAELVATGIKANEQRRIIRLQVDRAMIATAIAQMTRRASHYLGAVGVDLAVTMPDMDYSRLTATEKGRDFVESLAGMGKLSAKGAQTIGRAMGWIPQDHDPDEDVAQIGREAQESLGA